MVHLQALVNPDIAVDRGNLQQGPHSPRQVQFHIRRGQAPGKEEGSRGGFSLTDRENSLVRQTQLQLICVPIQHQVCLGIVQQMDGYIAVIELDIHALEVLGGKGGTGDGLALAPLTVEAAPLLAVSGGYHPVPATLLALCVLVVLTGGVLAVVVVIVVEVDVDAAVKAIGILLLQLFRHIPEDDLGLVHSILGLGDGLPDHLLRTPEEFVEVVTALALFMGQLSVGTQSPEIGQQLIHISQVIQGLGIGILLCHAGGGKIQIALVEIVAELFNEIRLGVGILGGGQTGSHRDDESGFHAIHGLLLLNGNEGVQQRPGILPLPAVFCPLPPSLVGDGVVAAPGAGAILSPVGGDEPALLQAAEGGIQGGLLEAVLPAGPLLDGFVDLVSVVVPPHQLGQDDGIRVPTQGIR